MATSAFNLSANEAHIICLQALVKDGGAIVVRNILDQKLDKKPLCDFLDKVRHEIEQLKHRGMINAKEWKWLYPEIGSPTTDCIHIVLAIKLLLRLDSFGLKTKFDFRTRKPPPEELSLEADVHRLRLHCKEILEEFMTSTTVIDKAMFLEKWTEIEQLLHRLNHHVPRQVKDLQEIIDRCKTFPFSMEQKVDDDKDANEMLFVDSFVEETNLKDTLPAAARLAELCQAYGRNSDTVKEICERICCNIKDECKHVVNVWPSYRPNEENNIVFCIITDIPCERINCIYSVVQRAIGEYSAEESAILKKESDGGLTFTDDAVENCIDKNADKYMDNHTYLSVVSASLLKSEMFGTPLQRVSQKVCIVLLVPIKGLIPLSEEAFPTHIDEFPVDVREGSFRYKFGGKPNDKHESLKMGCAIRGDKSGTLGGFLDHNEHGICCFTAAHVMLSTEKMKAIFPGPYVPTSVESCYQPEPPNTFGRLIKAIAKVGNANETGVDVALVKIDERIPLNGRFPDVEEEKSSEAGFQPTLEMQYSTGAVIERKKIPLYSRVLKFGQSTTLTKGTVRLRTSAVRVVNIRVNSEGYIYSLRKQIQVLPIGSVPFSKAGDSGALVFDHGNDDQLSAIGMLVGGTDNYDFVTPICDILREIDTTLSLKPFPHS